MAHILEVKQVSKYFKEKQDVFKAVDNLSFSIDSGQILAILGPNGAGKTTLVSMIGNYLLPTAGQIFIGGQDIVENTTYKPSVGVVFGGELGFYGRATLLDNLKFFADLDRIPYRSQKKEIHRVLSLVELDQDQFKKADELSKGMKQRLHIARSLLGSPKLLLLDEPTTGLDVEIAASVRSVIKNLTLDGTAILLTSHTMEEVANLASKIMIIGAGKKFFEGSVDDVISLSGVTHIDRKATLEESYLALAPELRRHHD